ncbi:LacI family DNA-binding transcriptional regulator [Yonghaparkia sp. Soil809]|uniref:LacI family DNA-binding transcriptional regulator n=1 Tax=Yonghaparkia sp. Soil809 TaxID=1736417 RepID=UPI003514FA99
MAASVRHLVELGHRDLLHIAGPASLSTSEARSVAFQSACAEAGVRGRLMEVNALTAEAGERAADAVIAGHPDRPTAIVAGNDLIALGVLRSLRRHGLECPTDLSVVGFNDMVFAEDFHPPLTTVRVPARSMGEEAARLLLRMLDTGEPTQERVMLPVSLVVRGSTGAPPRLR